MRPPGRRSSTLRPGGLRRVGRSVGPVELPGGLVLRPSTAADLDQIATLLAARGDATDAVDVRLVVHDPQEGFESCAVVVDGDRVVSTATLLRETLTIEDVSLAAGQVELVATDPMYEGRGLVRALMAWAHERSRRRGGLVQLLIGIPYFYRQFGYAYAMPMARWRALAAVPPAEPQLVVRRATVDDIPAMARLQDAAQARTAVRLPHSPACWRGLVARQGSTQWVVEHAGRHLRLLTFYLPV